MNLRSHLTHYKFGFTLVELMVVITIISLLSSVAIASLQTSREKARDTARISTLIEVRKALYLYRERYGRFPLNYSGGSPSAPVFVPGGLPGNSWGACDRQLPGIPGGGVATPGCPLCSEVTLINPQAYEASMQELVNAGFLGAIPRSRPGEPALCYQRLTGGNEDAYLVTTLTTFPPSTTGLQGSCRPAGTINADWCEFRTPNSSYCLCIE